MANQPQQSQPQSGQAQQHSSQQLEQVLKQHAQAHGLTLPAGINWGSLIFGIIQAFVNAGVIPGGGGVMPQAAGQQSSP